MATTTRTSSLDANVQDYINFILDEARGLYGQEYTPYPYQRIAGFSPDQTAGMDAARSNVGSWQPYYQDAASIARGLTGFAGNIPKLSGNVPQIDAPTLAAMVVGARQYPGADMSAYMNPYESLVTGAAIRSAEEAAARAGANADAKYAAAGAFGGSRQGVYDAQRENELVRTIAELTNASRAQNFTNAQGMWTQDANRLFQADSLNAQLGLAAAGQNASNYLKAATANADNYIRAGQVDINALLNGGQLQMNAAQLLGNLGTNASNAGYRDSQALLDIGGMQRQYDQSNLDLAYKDWTDQRDYGWNQLGRLSGALNGMPTNRTETTNSPDPNQWSQWAGLGLGALGLLQKTGAFGDNGWLTGGNTFAGPADTLDSFGAGGIDLASGDMLDGGGWFDLGNYGSSFDWMYGDVPLI